MVLRNCQLPTELITSLIQNRYGDVASTDVRFLYAFPSNILPYLQEVFGVTLENQPSNSTYEAEIQLSEICEKNNLTGYNFNGFPLSYDHGINFNQARQSERKLKKNYEFGKDLLGNMTVEEYKKINHYADENLLRLQAANGRLLVNPEFIDSVELLKNSYSELSDRELFQLPFIKSVAKYNDVSEFLSSGHEMTTTSKAFRKWLDDFIKFCNDWNLDGLYDWHLPKLAPVLLLDDDAFNEVKDCLNNNQQFPATFTPHSRSPISQSALKNQREVQASNGIDDRQTFLSYTRFYQIIYWESLIDSIYISQQVRFYETRKLELLSLLVDYPGGLEISTLKKLKGWINRFKSGELHSLKGIR